MEIEIKVSPRWEEADLAKRIARIVASDDTCCEKKSGGYEWALDYRGNDWWMTGIQDVEGQKYKIVKVAYRYGGGGSNKDMMEALKVFLQWEVGIHED